MNHLYLIRIDDEYLENINAGSSFRYCTALVVAKNKETALDIVKTKNYSYDNNHIFDQTIYRDIKNDDLDDHIKIYDLGIAKAGLLEDVIYAVEVEDDCGYFECGTCFID